MPIYEYKAFAAGGATTTGIVDADTERDAFGRNGGNTSGDPR